MTERYVNNFGNHSDCSSKKCIDALNHVRDRIDQLRIEKVTADIQLRCLEEKCCLEKQLMVCQCEKAILQWQLNACQSQTAGFAYNTTPDLSAVHALADCQTIVDCTTTTYPVTTSSPK